MNQFNGLPQTSPEKKGLIDQAAINAFATFLVQAKFALPENISNADIMKMVGLQSKSPIINWEQGDTLPEYESLGKIAIAYKIEGEKYRDFLKAYEISKNAREVLKNSRKQKSGQTFIPTYERGRSGRNGPKSRLDNGK
jgi:hypothetical protein